MADFNPNNYAIEDKYGVPDGGDWLTVMLAAPFQRGQRVSFNNGSTRAVGVVQDIRRNNHFTHDYEFLVKYDGKSVPRWTLVQWLSAD